MKKTPFIHTFLFGIFPVLFLYAHNIKEIPIDTLLRPLTFAFIFAVFIWLLFCRFLNDSYRANLIASFCLLLFYSYPWIILDLFGNNVINNSYIITKYFLFIIWGVIIISVIIFFQKTKSNLIRLNKFFNFIAIIIVAYNLSVVVYWFIQRDEVKELIIPASSNNNSIKPDIYYIILDAYARNDVLTNLYSYNNQEFLRYLSKNGFYIADKSKSNYAFTELSIASSLNFIYLNKFIKNSNINKNDRLPLIKIIKRNRLQQFLKKHGYITITLSTGFCPTEIKSSDLYFSPNFALSDFENLIINLTPLPLITKELQYNLHRERILYTFNKISEIVAKKSPKFVFAHIFPPHPPFVFGKNGEKLYHYKNFNRIDGKYVYNKEEYVEMYRDQLIFINKKLKNTIDKILTKKEKPTVIILQGDHGPRSMVNLENEKDTSLKEAMSIFLAIYATNCDKKIFYNTLTPVNIFRLILNYYFETDLKIIEDISYFSTSHKYYEFIKVNNKLKSNAPPNNGHSLF